MGVAKWFQPRQERLMIRLGIFLLHASVALGGGGSGLLIGLSKDGKTGSGSTSWEMLVICMAVGAAVIIAGGLAHYFWSRQKKKKRIQERDQQRLEKAQQAQTVGGGGATIATTSPPPAYNSCLEDE